MVVPARSNKGGKEGKREGLQIGTEFQPEIAEMQRILSL